VILYFYIFLYKMKTVCSGSITKTTSCPAKGCEWSRSGDPRRVNKLKELHMKYCEFIKDDNLRTELLKQPTLKTTSPQIEGKIRLTLKKKADVKTGKFYQTEHQKEEDLLTNIEQLNEVIRKSNKKS
jgi:hypothetical protein